MISTETDPITRADSNVEEWLNQLEVNPGDARDATHFRNIYAARAALLQAERDLAAAVAEAREAGDSWTIIGMALNTSRQGAQRKYRSAV